MDSLIVFSKIFNIPITKNKLIIPDDFNIFKFPQNIRSIIYTYFHLVSKQIEGLDWAKIGNFMNQDNEILYIDSVDPNIYYDNNIILNKLHIQDYDFIKKQINNIKTAIKYKNIGWNVNYYFDKNMLTLEEISKIKHASEVLNKRIIEINPDLFDLVILFKRFGAQLDLTKYHYHGDNYRLKCLDTYANINYDDAKWYSFDENVLKKILENEPKVLNPIFEECVLNSSNTKEISELYLKWFTKNRNPKYRFDALLQRCKNITILFKLGIELPTTSLEQFNYNYKYLQLDTLMKIMPSFSNNIWRCFKNENIIELLPKYNIHFKYLTKAECINFYNIFYKPTLEFYQTVFENKLLRVDDVNSLEHLNYNQAKYILKYWSENRGKFDRLYEILIQKLNIIEIYKLSLKDLIKTPINLSNQIYNKTDIDIVVKFIIQNNIMITKHDDINLIKTPELLKNISWKIIDNQNKFDMLFEYFIDNNIVLDYYENIHVIQKYIHTMSEHIIEKLSNEKILELIIRPLMGIKPEDIKKISNRIISEIKEEKSEDFNPDEESIASSNEESNEESSEESGEESGEESE